VDQSLTTDIVEITQLLAHYAANMTKRDIDAAMEVFTPDAMFSSFGYTRGMKEFKRTAEEGPKGLFITGPPAIVVDGDTGTGEQPVCFIDQTNHHMLLALYTDTYRRTDDGWRVQSRSMTFLRRSGVRDGGEPVLGPPPD
jgi:ketosteroid isomerase-like protein